MLTCVLGTCVVSVASAVQAQHVHFDVSPLLVNGKIEISALSHGSFTNPFTGVDTTPDASRYYVPGRRVFEYEFGEDPLFPTSAEDPGVTNEPTSALLEDGTTINLTGTGLPLTSSLSFTVMDDLKFWTGTGFGPVPDLETLVVIRGSTRTAGTGTGQLETLNLRTFSSNDDIHLHLDSVLNAPGGTHTEGVYLLTAKLESSATGVEDSDLFYVAFLLGEDELAHEEAVDFLNTNVVPEPASFAAIGLGMMALLKRRRRA